MRVRICAAAKIDKNIDYVYVHSSFCRTADQVYTLFFLQNCWPSAADTSHNAQPTALADGEESPYASVTDISDELPLI